MDKIGICDDDENSVDALREIVFQYSRQNNLEIEIMTFSSGIDLLKKYNGYDLIFLDIDMPEMNGIETAKVIRNNDVKCKVIYITNYKDYTHQAFSVRAYGYVVKPFTREVIEDELNDFLVDFKQQDTKHKVTFKGKYSDLIFNLEDIYYFEVIGKNVIEITLNERKVTIYCSLSNIFDKVNNRSFAIPHQSYIINLHYVNMMAKLEITMQNGDKIPIAQKRSKSFREQHSEFLQNTFTAI